MNKLFIPLVERTVMSGSVSRGKDSPSQSVQMIGRPLMTPDELKSIPKGHFVVMKTGTHPMKTQLRLFLDWGIRFGKAYELPEKAARPVSYANKKILIQAITERHPQFPMRAPTSSKSGGGMWEQEPPTAEYESNRSSSHRGPYNLSKQEDGE